MLSILILIYTPPSPPCQAVIHFIPTAKKMNFKKKTTDTPRIMPQLSPAPVLFLERSLHAVFSIPATYHIAKSTTSWYSYGDAENDIPQKRDTVSSICRFSSSTSSPSTD